MAIATVSINCAFVIYNDDTVDKGSMYCRGVYTEINALYQERLQGEFSQFLQASASRLCQ